MIKRWQEENLIHALSVRRGVHLTGARQCGKTTLARSIPVRRALSLDDESLRRSAKNDPFAFVERYDGGTLLIDEIQKAPELLEAIKLHVDADMSVGQYLLTGSSNLRFIKAVVDSLAGRLRTLRLRTLTLGEVCGGRGDFLSNAIKGEFRSPSKTFSKRDLVHHAFCGGYPEARILDSDDRIDWYSDYLNDLLMKDVKDVTEIKKKDSLRRVANWLLAHSSKFFDLKELGAKAQIAGETLENYLSALKALYVFDEVPAWSGSDYAKVGKRSKWYATDPGLVANLLGWSEESAVLDSDVCGKLFETWVYHELAVLVELSHGLELSQYRDSDRREIDFVIENRQGDVLAIEVKSGAVSQSDFKQIRWFEKHFAKGKFVGVVLYSGTEVLPFGTNCYAVPLSSLAG